MIDKSFRTREFYHHGICLEQVNYDILYSDINHTNEIERLPNLWLESIIGYYPTFIACGNDFESIFERSSYDIQFRRIKVYKLPKNVLRKKGEFPNTVLFSFQNLENVIYMDFLSWFGPLNEIKSKEDFDRVTKKWRKHVFKPSYSESYWRRKARNDPGTVMAAVPSLDLRTATTIYTRNKRTKKALEKIGFESQKISVERAKAYRYIR